VKDAARTYRILIANIPTLLEPGDGYHPEAFSDRAGYDEAIDDCYQAYLKRLDKKVSTP
jgi:hypothetical protein